MLNTFGNLYRLTAFGESHGEAIGGVIDGVPAGVRLDLDAIQAQVARRRPGQSEITTARNEKDRVRFLSGIFEGVTLGTPIAFTVENTDHHSADYDNLRDVCRPSHADLTYNLKYGVRDHRGGGRSSARTTIPHVVAGAVAMQILAQLGVEIAAYTSGVGHLEFRSRNPLANCASRREMLELIDANAVRCPDVKTAELMRDLILKVKSEGDTVGGTVSCIVRGCPPGLGEPIFGKLQAMLAFAMMNINAAKGFEYGMGFDGCRDRGSEMIDLFGDCVDGVPTTITNNSGGIQGGISNGMEIDFRVAFKPVATLLKEIPAIGNDGEPATLRARGRHDPCVVPRAVPIVESMAAMVILDAYMMNKARQ